MNVRQFLVLFISSMTLSLVILIVFFSLFFKNIDFHFDTRLPQSAPILPEVTSKQLDSKHESFKADGIQHAQVHVPNETQAPQVGVGINPLLPSAPTNIPASTGSSIGTKEVGTADIVPVMDAPLNDTVTVPAPVEASVPKTARTTRKPSPILPAPPPPEPAIPLPPQ